MSVTGADELTRQFKRPHSGTVTMPSPGNRTQDALVTRENSLGKPSTATFFDSNYAEIEDPSKRRKIVDDKYEFLHSFTNNINQAMHKIAFPAVDALSKPDDHYCTKIAFELVKNTINSLETEREKFNFMVDIMNMCREKIRLE